MKVKILKTHDLALAPGRIMALVAGRQADLPQGLVAKHDLIKAGIVQKAAQNMETDNG